MSDVTDGAHATGAGAADLGAVRDAALAILAAAPRLPGRLVVRAGEVGVELEWDLPPELPELTGLTGPATASGAAGLAAPAAPAPAIGADYVCAPLVGVFYRSPEPGARPFVVEGDSVVPGQQVGIVEAMKLMIPVEADRAGRVVAVLTEDGRAVEYGEPLFALEPAVGAVGTATGE